MIRLIDILKEVQQEQQVEEGRLGNLVTGAAMTAASMLGGARAQSKIPTDKPAITATKQGTSVDGILGQFTSQFKFPPAFLKDLDAGTTQDLGVEGNKTLTGIAGVGFNKTKMDQWNAFVDWMKKATMDGKTISGNPVLDTDSTLGAEVIDAYKKTPQGKSFWVKTGDDIKDVQSLIKAYRVLTIADWKKGDGTVDGGHSIIKVGEQVMYPKDPKDVKAVEDRYMKWAK